MMLSDKDFLLNLERLFFIIFLPFHFVILFNCQSQQTHLLIIFEQTGSSITVSVGGLKIIVQHQHLFDMLHVRQD